jgi:5-methylcytosine-specific restriction protein A
VPYAPKPLLRPAFKGIEHRPSAAVRGYGRDWQRLSKAFLADHPLCECDDCKAGGLVTPAEVVDHVIPHRGNQRLFWDRSNWRAMSKRCHDRKTASCDRIRSG